MSLYTTPRVGQPQLLRRSAPRPSGPPPLAAGDRLGRAEFERRYLAHPEIRKAELVEGVVYVPSPVHFAQHGQPHFNMITWLGAYCAATPGILAGGDNVTIRLDFENEVQRVCCAARSSPVSGCNRPLSGPATLRQAQPVFDTSTRSKSTGMYRIARQFPAPLCESSALYQLHRRTTAKGVYH